MTDRLLGSHVGGFANVPSILRLLTADLPPGLVFDDIQMIILTGETTTWDDIKVLRPHLCPGATVYNLFGQTRDQHDRPVQGGRHGGP